MTFTVITNIKELIITEATNNNIPLRIETPNMANITSIKNAYLLIKNEKIFDYGKMSDISLHNDILNKNNITSIDAKNGIVMPAFCDPHTHLVFANTREEEFIMRIKGMSYEEIAQKGGGILNSAKKLRQTSENELFDKAIERINNVVKYGTGAIEIKSGYGLTLEDEIKILKVIRRLKETQPVKIKATFLGAHAIPEEYKNERNKYIDIIIKRMIPQIASEKLADYCDVFCEKGFFTINETEKILDTATKYGLKTKLHANQLSNSGAVQTGIKYKCSSIDHLENIGDEEINIIKHSNTMPTLLPNASFFLNMPYAPARKFIDNNISIAIASDYNPGTAPSANMQFVWSLACIKMKLTPEEAFNAITLNAAFAMDISQNYGSITKNKIANIIITHDIPSIAYIPYDFGNNNISKIILNGKLI